MLRARQEVSGGWPGGFSIDFVLKAHLVILSHMVWYKEYLGDECLLYKGFVLVMN